jgi:hypothetical protein
LLREAVVKEGHPAVQKYNWRSTAIDLSVKLLAPYFDVTLSATEAIRVRSRGSERDDSGENGTGEVIYGVSPGGQFRCNPALFEETVN